jgi:hypothetical protein
MPKVVCEKHSDNFDSTFCCNHLASAVIGNGRAIRYSKLNIYSDEGGPLFGLEQYICFDCLKKYNLTKNKYDCEDADNLNDDSTWPSMTPVCSDCLKEYTKNNSNILNL